VNAEAPPRHFLVLSGANDRAVFAFLRAARRCGASASIIAMSVDDLVFKSAYAPQVVLTRETKDLTTDLFEHWVDLTRQAIGRAELVIYPSSEYLNTFLLRNRSVIEQLGCVIPLIDEEVYRHITNKESSTSFFASYGIATPEAIPSASISTPLVAKPRININRAGRSLYPHLLRDEADLEEFLASESRADFFFQRWVEGPSFYLLFYVPRDGSTPVSMSQENLVQQPGGKSMLFAVGASIHETAVAGTCLTALRDVGFHGLCMIEFIEQDGQLYFIELNPRPWGPIQFCEDMGAPMLESLISDWSGFAAPTSRISARRRYYAWLGGMAASAFGSAKLVTHGTTRVRAGLMWAAVRNDVYLRRDTWRCFFHELWAAISGSPHD
jgi:hypothetical protein